MKYSALALICFGAFAPNALLADEYDARLQVMLCQTDTGIATFSFRQAPDGELSLIGESDAIVSKSSNAVTVLVGDKVLQFQSNQLQTLANGSLQSSDCADVTDTVVQLAKQLAMPQGASSVQFGGIVPVAAPPMPDGLLLTGAEREAFQVSVNRCWSVDPGSVAARTTVRVGVSLDEKGRVTGDVRLLSAGEEEEVAGVAFEAARRAVLRCQGGGYPLPTDKFEQWKDVDITFDPTAGIRLN